MSLSTCEKFTRLFVHMCEHDGDDGHGYTQAARWGNGEHETVDLGDGARVVIQKGDRDCSSAVISALAAVGVDVGEATYTGNMRRELLKTGLFTWHDQGDGYSARRGDIYLNEVHHTAVCTCDDPDTLAQFSISENGTTYGRTGDQTGRESNIRSYYNYPWDGKLAWIDRGGASDAAAVEPGTYTCVVDFVNVRTSPSTSAEIVARYTEGQSVVLDGATFEADGYIWGRYIGASSGKNRYVAVREVSGREYFAKN